MKITAITFYGGSQEKVCRLGLAEPFFELQQILFDTVIEVSEVRNANETAVVRTALNDRFERAANWKRTGGGGVGWIKKLRYNVSILVRLGVGV